MNIANEKTQKGLPLYQNRFNFFYEIHRYWTMDRSLQRRLQKTNYQHIKRLCRDRGQLFEDVDFQPVARSLYKNKKPGFHPIVWLRPHVSKIFITGTYT